MRLKADPRLRFAGQITGVEGYVESAAMGLLAGRMAAAERLGRPLDPPPPTPPPSARWSRHITGGAEARTFQPMNVNFGLFPPLDDARGGRRGRKDRYKGYTDRRQGGVRRAGWRRLRCRRDLARGAGGSYVTGMNYVLALFLPPLSILFAGRPLVAIVTFLIWLPAILIGGGLSHPLFILLAWVLIYQGGEERRARRLSGG